MFTTLNIYSHITDTMQQQAAARIDREIGGTDAQMPEVKQTHAEHKHARKRAVRARRAPSRARPEKDSQVGHRMHLSDKRSPLGRQLLSKTAKR